MGNKKINAMVDSRAILEIPSMLDLITTHPLEAGQLRE